MKLKQKLQHPFVLVVEGFIAGAIILYATTPADVRQGGEPAPTETAQAPQTPQA